MAFDQVTTDLLEANVTSLGEYRPYRWHIDQGGSSSDWPVHSSRTLDLKKKYDRGLNYFFNYMVDKVKTPEAIAVVPSSNAGTGPTTGVHVLADRLCDKLGIENAGTCLVRHTTIAKKATGGDRSIEVDLNSIRVDHPERIKGKVVLLLDDVTTSGNSLLAGRRLLLKAGAKEVKLVALSRTTH